MNTPFVSLLMFTVFLMSIFAAEYRLYTWLFQPVKGTG